MPGYAKPASSQFALPVPEDWAEHEPFKEEKLGAKASMAGSFIYPGTAAEAAQTYRDLLTEAGFAIHNHPLGEATNQASFKIGRASCRESREASHSVGSIQ